MLRARWLRLAGLMAVVLSGLVCASANASVEIGQAGQASATIACAGGVTWVQDSTSSPPGYAVPAGGGVIVSWRTVGPGNARLKVFRRSDPLHPELFFIVGESAPQAISASNPGPFSINPGIRVAAGDLIGFATGAGGLNHCEGNSPGDTKRSEVGDPAPGTTFDAGPSNADIRLNIAATVEPDIDADAFGDESQDACPGVAGTVTGCPQADLAVSETASPNPSPVHGRFSYLVQVHNNGPSAVPGGLATVADTVGPSVTLLSATSAGGPCTLGAIVRCPVAALGPGASTTINVTVRADAEGGKANATTVSYAGDTNPANNTAGFTATVVPAASISNASVSPKTWRLGSALPRFSRRAPVGTTIRFKLTQPARATLTFSQPKLGRKVGRRCVTQTRRNKHNRRCTIPNVRGTLTVTGHARTNKVRFQGRLSRTKTLKPGRYTLTITATDSAGNRSNAKSTTFTIVRG
jgi:hypothetical protein